MRKIPPPEGEKLIFRRHGSDLPRVQRGVPVDSVRAARHPDDVLLLDGGQDNLGQERHLRDDRRLKPQVQQGVADVEIQEKGEHE